MKLAPILISLGVAGAIATGAAIQINQHPTVTLPNGLIVPGRILFAENFDGTSLDTTKWTVEDDLVSALLEHGSPFGCVRHENVSVSGGQLHLTMSSNVRANCPQTWSVNAYYTANFAASFPSPSGSSFDTASISMKKFHARFGHIFVSAKFSGGTSPWSAILLWGSDCQPGGAMHNLMAGIFTQAGTACNWPAPGSNEFDIPSYVHSDSSGTDQIIAALHLGPGNGAPFLRNFGTIPYYGSEFAPHLDVAGYQPYVTTTIPADPSTGFHLYELIWGPNYYEWRVDGQIGGQNPAAWVTTDHMFMQLWNVDNSGTVAGLPQTMDVDWVYWICQPGTPCDSSG